MSGYFHEKGFVKENYETIINRYKGFGKDIYRLIKIEFPEIFKDLKFYRNTINQIEDSYAEYENDINGFNIQLEPIGKVIVLWNEIKHFEFGTWANDEYKDALNCIKNELLISNKKNGS